MGRAALCTHPAFGSVWLNDAEVKEGHVVGWTWENGPVAGSWVKEYMNFPATCVRKWTPPEGARDG